MISLKPHRLERGQQKLPTEYHICPDAKSLEQLFLRTKGRANVFNTKTPNMLWEEIRRRIYLNPRLS